MTISSEVRKAGPYTGNGVTVDFPFLFKVFSSSDVSVTIAVLATGLETVLTSGYTVALNADQNANPGGTVTYNPSGTPIDSTKTLTIGSRVPNTQGTHLLTGGAWLPGNVEDMIDRVTIEVQQLVEKVNRAIRFAFTDITPPADLPTAAQRAGKVLGFDGVGQVIMMTLQAGTSLVNLAASTGASLIGFISGLANAIATTVQDRLRQEAFASDFGTLGTADDYALLQAAINSATAAGMRLIIPAGLFIIGYPLRLPDYADVKGMGDLTVIKAKTTALAFQSPWAGGLFIGSVHVADGVDQQTINSRTRNVGIRLRDLKIDAQHTANTYGIDFIGVSDVIIENIHTVSTYYVAICVQYFDHVIVRDCVCDITTTGSGGIQLLDGYRWLIDGNVISGAKDYAIEYDSGQYDNTGIYGSGDGTISNNIITDFTNYGICVRGMDTNLNCTAGISDGAGGVGTILNVSVVGANTIAVGNQVTGAGVTSCLILSQLTGTTGGVGTYSVDTSQLVAPQLIRLRRGSNPSDAPAHSVIVIGNHCGGGNTGVGAGLGLQEHTQRIAFIGNNSYSNSGSGLDIQGGSSLFQVKDNIFHGNNFNGIRMVSPTYFEISGNQITDNYYSGIYSSGQQGSIHHNIITGNGMGAANQDGIELINNLQVDISDNTLNNPSGNILYEINEVSNCIANTYRNNRILSAKTNHVTGGGAITVGEGSAIWTQQTVHIAATAGATDLLDLYQGGATNGASFIACITGKETVAVPPRMFFDVVIGNYNGADFHVVATTGNLTTGGDAPAARTYAMVANVLRVTMAADAYKLNCKFDFSPPM